MTKVLLIGNSACSHAIAHAYQRSGARVFAYGQVKNPGIFNIAEGYQVGGLDDLSEIAAWANKVQPDFVFIGPPGPIAAGVADMLNNINFPTIAPGRQLAQLETSKAFTRRLLEKYNIPGSLKYKVFSDTNGMQAFAQELNGQFVVKANGLRATMGVQVAGDHFKTIEEGLTFARECVKMDGTVVIEEKLAGEEFSLMSFCDGVSTVDMPAVQDFKRALEGDAGPNTGGMGAYTDTDHLLPFLSRVNYDLASEITRQVVSALSQELALPYRGILFGGFMITNQGLRVLEYNVRAGDPEGINAFALLKTNLVDLSLALLNKELNGMDVVFEDRATVCKYIAPIGYPEKGQDAAPITIGQLPEGVTTYTAWVKQTPAGLAIDNKMTNGRAIAVLGRGENLKQAEERAEHGCRQITGPVYHRSDIASPALIAKKLERMKMF